LRAPGLLAIMRAAMPATHAIDPARHQHANPNLERANPLFQQYIVADQPVPD